MLQEVFFEDVVLISCLKEIVGGAAFRGFNLVSR